MGQSKDVVLKDIVKEYVAPNKSIFRAVNCINLTIPAGEFITLLGPSGCGKTTTLRMIAGFETPTQGDIYLGNERINDLTPDKRDTAMVFQSYALFPHYNVFNNIAYGLRLKRMKDKEINRKVGDIISLVGLEGMEERFPNQISGGQQQRVALARALVMEPGVMLFDEPLSNLDAKLRVYMRTEIRKIQRRLKLTSVYVTHDQAEAMSLSDRIIVMNQGIIEQVGTPQEIYQRPASRFVADFIGRANFFPAEIKSCEPDKVTVEALGCIFEVANINEKLYEVGTAVICMIRPEAVEIQKEGALEGVIETSTYMGENQEYIIKIGETMIFGQETNPTAKQIYGEGEKVNIRLRPETIHILEK